MSSDEEDFVFYGTPIEREEELTTRKKKAIAEASGQLRTALPPWKQEVNDLFCEFNLTFESYLWKLTIGVLLLK